MDHYSSGLKYAGMVHAIFKAAYNMLGRLANPVQFMGRDR